jgi:autotransporter-associated beta strand protein
MKIALFCSILAVLSHASVASAQTNVIYWTGESNRWAGDPGSFSGEPRGSQHERVRSGSRFHFVYNTNAMTGKRLKVLMNRKDVVMYSWNIASPRDDGFTFDTTENNSTGIVLAGTLNAVSGRHFLENSGEVSLILAGPLTWNIEEPARIINRIHLAGPGGITKTGGGTLLMRHAENRYTGDTIIREGAFGGSGSLTGNLHFAKGAQYHFNPNATLRVGGTVTFERFGMENVATLDESVAQGSYIILTGRIDTRNLRNLGKAKAHALGKGKVAYFEQQEESLQIIVAPR